MTNKNKNKTNTKYALYFRDHGNFSATPSAILTKSDLRSLSGLGKNASTNDMVEVVRAAAAASRKNAAKLVLVRA